jgi:hypothetical protein
MRWSRLSTDYGHTFRYLDPSTIVPDAGLSLCCDQQVVYSPKYNLFVWELQYSCAKGTSNPPTNDCRNVYDGTGANRIRIAFSTPESLTANAYDPWRAWSFVDLTPQEFGQPVDSWFDRSWLAVNDWNINWSVLVMRSNRGGVPSLLARIPLDEAAHSNPIDVQYHFDAEWRMVAAQGRGSTSYFVGVNSLSQERIVSWEAFSNLVFRHDINHSSVPNCQWEMRGMDGADWRDRAPFEHGLVESATLSGHTLYVAHGTGRAFCDDEAHPVFKQPAIFISRYDVNSWKESDEFLQEASHSIGFAWPALQTDGAGEVGFAAHAAAGGENAGTVVGFLTPDLQAHWAISPGPFAYETGDYYSLQPGRTPHSFVTTGETIQFDTKTVNVHWNFIEYGHGPPPYVAPPNVSITSPKNQANFKQGATVTYKGVVHDPIDGALPSAAIVWGRTARSWATACRPPTPRRRREPTRSR